jgi:hypothetical protein
LGSNVAVFVLTLGLCASSNDALIASRSDAMCLALGRPRFTKSKLCRSRASGRWCADRWNTHPGSFIEDC